MNAVDIEIQSVTKQYGKVVAVDDLNLSIAKGEFLCLLGPSGCGKTTTLRMIAGFENPTSGWIIIQGRDVTDVPPHKRDTGMVFQNYALFPHMTVFGNLSYGLKNRKVPKVQIVSQVRETLEMIGMSGMEDRYPRQLSGGQQQRVAVARVLVTQPKILLFDEPLSNLDAKLRVQMRMEIRNLQKRVGITSIFVTHDQEEALALADRVVVMNEGRIEQGGTPAQIYDNPRTRFMADFIGICNVFEGTHEKIGGEGAFSLKTNLGMKISFECPGQGLPSESLQIAVRPESMVIYAEEPNEGSKNEGYNVAPAIIESVLRLGPITEYWVHFDSRDKAIVHSQYQAMAQTYKEGERVWVKWSVSACHCLIDKEKEA